MKAKSQKIDLYTVARLMIILRLVVTGIALSAVLFVLSPAVPKSVIGLLLVILPLSLLWWMMLKLGVGIKSLLLAQVVTDVVIESGIVRFTGAVTSGFTPLYLLTIFIAGVLLSSQRAYLVATMSSLFFAATAGFTGVPPEWQEAGSAYLAFQIAFQVSLFYLAALLSSWSSQVVKDLRVGLDRTSSELRRARSDLDLIIRSMNSGLVTIASDGVIEQFNEAASKILRLDPSEVLGRSYQDVFIAISRELAEAVRQALEGGKEEKRGEVSVQTRDGNSVPIGISISLLSGDGKERAGAVMVFQDLTDVKKMADKIRLADRLSAMGKLAAAIAHEIRTPLASICGSVEMLREVFEPGSDDRKLADLVIKESERLTRKIDHFLEFARTRPKVFRETDLSALLTEVLCIVKNHPRFSQNTTVSLEVASEIRISIDEESMKQVFYNLAINAVEAITQSGRIAIDASITEVEGQEYVAISFEDNGVGIDEKDVDKVFEPFYTSKKDGTGLGLAIASKIVEDHSGWINIRSKKGVGTTVIVYLPLKQVHELVGPRAEAGTRLTGSQIREME